MKAVSSVRNERPAVHILSPATWPHGTVRIVVKFTKNECLDFLNGEMPDLEDGKKGSKELGI